MYEGAFPFSLRWKISGIIKGIWDCVFGRRETLMGYDLL